MKFFSILSRYISRQLLANFFMVFFAILGIILLFNSIEALRRVSGREDIGILFTIEYAVTRISKTIEIVFPFIMMVAAMITFWRLSKNNEFVIIRTAGVSIFGFLRPLIITAFCLGLFSIMVLNPISAKMFELFSFSLPYFILSWYTTIIPICPVLAGRGVKKFRRGIYGKQ